MPNSEDTQLTNSKKEAAFSTDITQICNIAKTLHFDTAGITLPIEGLTELESSHPKSQVAGKYDVIHEIGRGGMGKILLWKDRNIQRIVATKMLISGNQSQKVQERFFEEGQITGQLEHPNIVPLHEMGMDGDNLYFTMKYVKGESLQQVIDGIKKNPNGVWTQNKIFRIFQAICDAVEYAHSKKVIHRDLKPSNIMIGNFGEVMVMDWGLAKVIGQGSEIIDENSITTLREKGGFQTITGQIAGTPLYMAPEQARGEIEKIDYRSDIYALGVILHNILTGKQCVYGTTMIEIIANVCQGKHNDFPKKGIWGIIPRELKAIVKKAMSFLPENRYQSVNELSQDIQRFLDHRQVKACSYNLWDIIQNTRKRYRKEILLVMLTSSLFFIASFFWNYYATKKESENEVLLAQKQLFFLEEKFSFLSDKNSSTSTVQFGSIINIKKEFSKIKQIKNKEKKIFKEITDTLEAGKSNEFEKEDDSIVLTESDVIIQNKRLKNLRSKKRKQNANSKNITKQQFNYIKKTLLNCAQKYQEAYKKMKLYRYKKLEATTWGKLYQAAILAKNESWQEICEHEMRKLLSRDDYSNLKLKLESSLKNK